MEGELLFQPGETWKGAAGEAAGVAGDGSWGLRPAASTSNSATQVWGPLGQPQSATVIIGDRGSQSLGSG